MGIKSLALRAAGRAGDAIAKVSSLSPAQLDEVRQKREAYFDQKPDPSDEAAVALTNRLLAACGVEIHNAYLPQISQIYSPVEVDVEYRDSFDSEHNIRFIKISKWVIDSEENSLEKLVNVYDVLADAHCNIALIFNRTKTTTDVYLAVVNTDNSASNLSANRYQDRIESAMRGNFPGSAVSAYGEGRVPCLEGHQRLSVAAVSNIPAEKSEKFISQTIEKVLDGTVPSKYRDEYTILLLATPVHDVEERKLRLAELYTALAPYMSWQTNFTYTESDNTSSSATLGFNIGAGAGTQTGASGTTTENSGISDSTGSSITDSSGTNQSISHGRNQSTTGGLSFTEEVGVSGGVKPFGVGVEGNASISATESLSTTAGTSVNSSSGSSTSHAVARTLGRAVNKGLSRAAGFTNSLSFGINFGANFARSSTVTATVGKNEGITQSFTNYTIKHALDQLEAQMKRLDQASALGMWDFAAYVLSENPNTASNVAHAYLSLTQGEESYLSQAAINTWRGDLGHNEVESGQAAVICQYLRDLRHPLFALAPRVLENDPDFAVYPTIVTATTTLSGKELAYSLNFPRKSVPGLPVIECAEFGRNISTFDDVDGNANRLKLGSIFHMHHEEDIEAHLATDSLAAHTFVTGSTGAGKTNTVCHILDEAWEKGIKFLVIEPAKGEYKDAFGGDEDVSVYGTNPSMAPLLRINPFSFPESIHVLEHLDRLVEVFNACWPMYAAMPAVLKDAIERSYADCGWDLIESTNVYGDDLYPSFADIARNVQQILDTSEYDAENKGAYKGSLLTRLKSLTNGINGTILSCDEIGAEDLFDANVIVDLSRVGSNETKALLMGLLVLKLQEYRMATGNMNQPLRHLTVLEEAHNLLRRTSPDQSSEAGNLQGKSVEMLANAIAEMRTYGEGFIIADQAPGLLDMSVIRNTNTKIIMRIPDLSDRELVGRAANLNDAQITELARLPRGVAAVYQNDWIEPVLCKVDKATEGEGYTYVRPPREVDAWCLEDALSIADLLTSCVQIDDASRLRDVSLAMERVGAPASVKVAALRILEDPPTEPRMTKLAPIMSALFPKMRVAVERSYRESARDPESWTRAALESLPADVRREMSEQLRRDVVQAVITDHVYNVQHDVQALEDWTRRGGLR